MKEVEYLRNELNIRLGFFLEHSHKIIGNVLLAWSGALILFGTTQGFLEASAKKVVIPFIVALIFFISEIILLFASKKDNDNRNQIFMLAAYLAIFHEERVSKTKKRRGSWEIAIFEISQNKGNAKAVKKMNEEYFALSLVSNVAIFLFSIFIVLSQQDALSIGLFILSLAISIFSVYLSVRIYKNSTLKDCIKKTQKEHLRSFLSYAIDDVKCFTKECARAIWRKFL